MSVPGCFGDEGVCSLVSDGGRRHGFFFGVGWEVKVSRSMEFKLCSLPCLTFKQTKFLYYINSLYSGSLVTDVCWSGGCEGHGTDVPWTGMFKVG